MGAAFDTPTRAGVNAGENNDLCTRARGNRFGPRVVRSFVLGIFDTAAFLGKSSGAVAVYFCVCDGAWCIMRRGDGFSGSFNEDACFRGIIAQSCFGA